MTAAAYYAQHAKDGRAPLPAGVTGARWLARSRSLVVGRPPVYYLCAGMSVMTLAPDADITAFLARPSCMREDAHDTR